MIQRRDDQPIDESPCAAHLRFCWPDWGNEKLPPVAGAAV